MSIASRRGVPRDVVVHEIIEDAALRCHVAYDGTGSDGVNLACARGERIWRHNEMQYCHLRHLSWDTRRHVRKCHVSDRRTNAAALEYFAPRILLSPQCRANNFNRGAPSRCATLRRATGRHALRHAHQGIRPSLARVN